MLGPDAKLPALVTPAAQNPIDTTSTSDIRVHTDVEMMTVDEAKAITNRIRQMMATAWTCITEAYNRRAWVPLGYNSWDAYCNAEFDGAHLRLPREERQGVVASLRESGLSLRAIESATGVSRKTIISDIKVVESTPRCSCGTPTCQCIANRHCWHPVCCPGFGESQVVESTPPEESIAEVIALVVGVDGKTYKPRQGQPANLGAELEVAYTRLREAAERAVTPPSRPHRSEWVDADRHPDTKGQRHLTSNGLIRRFRDEAEAFGCGSVMDMVRFEDLDIELIESTIEACKMATAEYRSVERRLKFELDRRQRLESDGTP